jgi:SAM-dependent methyltransferase
MVAEGGTPGAEQAASSPFATTETVYDPETYRLLYARGIDDGWRCLEVGGGGGSIAQWLCRRAGSSGRVVVTDLDITHLGHLSGEANLEIERHDVLTDPIPERAFNLVHARLVMGEIREPQIAVARLVASLRVGGWLVLEDNDRTSLAADPDDKAAADLFSKVEAAVDAELTASGLDPAYGRRLYRQLAGAGLVDVITRGANAVQAGGQPLADLLLEELAQMRERLIGGGRVSTQEVDGVTSLLRDPDFVFMSPTLVTAWGRRPPSL